MTDESRGGGTPVDADEWLKEEYRLLAEHYFHEDNQFFNVMGLYATLSSALLAFVGSTFASPIAAANWAVPSVGLVICVSWVATLARIYEWRLHIEHRAKAIESYVYDRWPSLSVPALDIHTARDWNSFRARLPWWMFVHKVFRSFSTAHTLTILPTAFALVWAVLLVANLW